MMDDSKRLIALIKGKSAQEIYKILSWLMNDYGSCYTNSEVAIEEWLKGVSE